MTLQAWRIVKEKYAASALSGEGARLNGGRWNAKGRPVIYTSASLALAALETLVHLNPRILLRYVAGSIRFDAALVEIIDPDALPTDWRAEPPPLSTQRLGDLWLTEARSAILEVPSVIVPAESNYLLNPAHADFRKVVIGKAEAFGFDPRLL